MIAALVALAVMGGFWAIRHGLRPPTEPLQRRRRHWGLPRRPILIGAAAGLVAFGLTGWPVVLVAGPVAGATLPWLLSGPGTRQIDLLSALDRWVHGITATVGTGRSITDALRRSRRGVPPLLEESVTRLVARLDDRWTTSHALRVMADELDSPDADAVIAALIVAGERGGTGAGVVLSALADSNQRRLRALRDIETERAKPRVVVRQVTAVTGIVLVAAVLVGRDYFEPYGTPVGQIIFACLVAAYLASLVLLRLIATPPAQARILRRVS